MLQIAIQDANILIDLVKTGLFDHCLALHYRFTTTNIILNELFDEQILFVQPHINSGKFVIIEISETELIEIQEMSKENIHLSEQDWSAVYYAKQKSALLLSGDRQLRNLAKSKGLSVHGIFWLLDQLLESEILTTAESCSFLKSLSAINKRLPQIECDKRIELWCGK